MIPACLSVCVHFFMRLRPTMCSIERVAVSLPSRDSRIILGLAFNIFNQPL